MKPRRLLLVALLFAGGLFTASNPVTADVVDGNPVFTDHHQVTLSKYVSLRASKPDPCSSIYGPPCNGVMSSVTVQAPQFGGNPNAEARLALCNLRVITPPVGGGTVDGQGDPSHGCDWGNALGRLGHSTSPLTLDALGNCCTQGPQHVLEMPSSSVLTQVNETCCPGRTGENSNPEAVCPPTPAQIAGGWTCVVELSSPITTGQPIHGGYRNVYLKSPIPAITCAGHSCPPFIPTGTQITVSGVQFPCKVIRPDDTVATPNVYDGACIRKWKNKTILIKRVSPKGIVATVTPTSQTAGLDGSYSITFTMPSVPAGGQQYKVIPHSPDCSLPCDSGNFKAAGKLFVHQ